MRKRRIAMVVGIAIACLALGAPVGTAAPGEYTPGTAGVGDPYFPLEGNGGYDVQHYDLTLSYSPRTDRLPGRTAIRARALIPLTRFDLDLKGMKVRGVTVNGQPAAFHRAGQELQVTPATPLAA